MMTEVWEYAVALAIGDSQQGRGAHFSSFVPYKIMYGTFQNDCFVSGFLQESVDIKYKISIQTSNII